MRETLTDRLAGWGDGGGGNTGKDARRQKEGDISWGSVDILHVGVSGKLEPFKSIMKE